MYFQFIHGSDRYLQVLDMNSCTYFGGGGSTFRTEAVASARAPGREMNLSNTKRIARVERGEWRAEEDVFRKW